MNKQLAFLLVALVASPAAADIAVFQQGVNTLTGLPDESNGYQGTVDTRFFAGQSSTNFGGELGVSVDLSDGGFPTQGALRFEDLFTTQGGPIPTNEPILFAEIEVFVTSDTDPGARISFDRVLGPDQNRASGSGPWSDSDTWDSLGGDAEATGSPPVLDGETPISVGLSTTLGPGNESVFAPESFDAAGNPRGILPREFNSVDIPQQVAEGVRVTIDVTDSVQSWQMGEPNLGWSINNDTTAGWDFRSSEWSLDELEGSALGNAQAELAQLAITRGVPEVFDVQLRPLLRVVYGLSGDVNQNGSIDVVGTPGGDFEQLIAGLGNSFATRGEPGDLDFDRDIDLDDFSLFKVAYDNEFGVGAFAAATVTAPEPGVLSLMLSLIFPVATRRTRGR